MILSTEFASSARISPVIFHFHFGAFVLVGWQSETISLIVLAGLLGISFLMKGMANTWIGAVGFTGIVMAVCGLWYGFAGFKDDSKSYFCSKCGTILSTVAIAGWFFIVCLGLAG